MSDEMLKPSGTEPIRFGSSFKESNMAMSFGQNTPSKSLTEYYLSQFQDSYPTMAMSVSPSKDRAQFTSLEDKFCKNFSCCSLDLNDLHELIQHFEECHVNVEDDPDFYLSDDELDVTSGSSSDSTAFGNELPFEIDFGIDLNDLGTHTVSQNMPQPIAVVVTPADTISATSSGPCAEQVVPPQFTSTLSNLTEEFLKSHNQNHIGNLAIKDLESSFSEAGSANSPVNASIASNGIAKKASNGNASKASSSIRRNFRNPQASKRPSRKTASAVDGTALEERPYKCKYAGCFKSYKNPGGLKYHKNSGHAVDTGDRELNYVLMKPFLCLLAKCDKRYKNLNGLKYHYLHGHRIVLNGEGQLEFKNQV